MPGVEHLRGAPIMGVPLYFFTTTGIFYKRTGLFYTITTMLGKKRTSMNKSINLTEEQKNGHA